MSVPDLSPIAKAWKKFVEAASSDPEVAFVRPLILDSWQRCRQSGLDPKLPTPILQRVSDIDVRLAANSALIQAADRLLDDHSLSLGDIQHVVYLTDRDGVVLYSTGNATMMKIYGLLPGYDWSEATMGTNGAGTAIAARQPVAVMGPEHYQLPFHEATCLAAPILDRTGEVVGAIDLSTHVDAATPELFKDVARLASKISAALRHRRESVLSNGDASAIAS